MPSWKKVIISGSNAELSSLFAPSITGSLQGTASYFDAAVVTTKTGIESSLYSTSPLAGNSGSRLPLSSSISFGYQAGYNSSASVYVNLLGYRAGYQTNNVSYSNFLGHSAGSGADFADFSNFFGYRAGYLATYANNSTFIGYIAGQNQYSASYSTIIGNSSGRSGSWGALGINNIIIGTNISLPNATANAINIGGVLFGTGTYSTTSGNNLTGSQANGRIGIGIVTPTATLHVNNNSTANSFLVEDSTNPDNTPFLIDNAGNVMIGTTSSMGEVTIASSGADGLVLDTDTSSNTNSSRIFLKNSGSGRDISIRNSGHALIIGHSATAGTTSGPYAMIISGSGVAIGNNYTISAGRDAALQVSGSINIEEGFAYKQDGYDILYATKGTAGSSYDCIVGGATAATNIAYIDQATIYGYAALSNSSGSAQTAVGYAAGNYNTGSNQTLIGWSAGNSAYGSNQTAVGRNAGAGSVGVSQTATGYLAGYQNTGDNQTAIGESAGAYNISTSQTAIGESAGYQNSGSDQTAVGRQAGYQNSGSNQTATGYQAGYKNSGSNQTAIGDAAGFQNTATQQTAIGVNAGLQNSGVYQTAIGVNSGYRNSGSNQTAIGQSAGYENSATQQTAVGLQAGYQNTGIAQTALGQQAGQSNSASTQTAVGYAAGFQNSGSVQVAIGAQAGRDNKGANQTATGYEAGRLNTADNQSAYGYDAGYQNTGISQTAIGVNAGYQNSGAYQTATGYSTGFQNSGSSQTATGYQAGSYNSGSNQVATGFQAGVRNIGNNQTVTGYQAGYENSGSNQTAYGYQAGFENSGSNQVVMGNSAGESNSGNNQTAVGSQAGYLNTGSNQTAVGYAAGFRNSGIYQTAIGSQAGYQNSGSNQTAVGYNAGYQNSGSDNTNVGYRAGYLITTGTVNSQSAQSVFLGSETRAQSGNQTNQIVIGYNAIGIGSNSVVLGNSSITTTALRGNVGIGTTTPLASLHTTGSAIISGSMVIGSSSLGPNENTLTLGARDSVQEGGQVGFNASGGTYTSASFIDLYQNRLRILKGTNATSTGEVANWNMHNLQMALPAYQSPASFPGTASGYLAFDSVGSILTVAGITATPGGTTTQLQYNSASVLAGTSAITFDGTTLRATGSFTGSFIGGLTGTASFASTASQAVYATNASDILIYVKNTTGTQIDKGKVVRITGATGDNALIATASYESDSVSANTLGITQENIANDAFGYVITEGRLIGINTNLWTAGQLLFLGANGSITGSAPLAPLHAVRLGQVLRVQLNNGSMYVRIDNGYELNELHDVADNTTTGSYGDLLVKSGSVWTNSNQLSGSYGLTGSLSATSFTGSLQGTASFALTASLLTPNTNAFIQGGNSFGTTALLGTNDNQNLNIETSGSVRMTISSSGDVGIGTLTPTTKLDIVYASTSTGVLIRGGGGVADSTPLKLWDTGTAINNRNIIEFGHNSTYVTASRIYSTNPSPNATTGGKLVLETTSDNVGTFNTNQLVLSNNGNVGINTTTPLGKLTVSGSGGYLSYNDTDAAGNLLLLSGSSDELVRIDVSALSASAGTTLSYGIRGVNDTAFATYGKVTDGFMYASNFVNGLNIINYGEGTKEDYIRFYAGKNADGTTPDLHIQGSGSNKGFIGINKINPNARLDVNGNTIITGSLTVTGGITGSITASGVFGPYGSNSVISASFAVSASNALTASYFNATIQTSGSSIYSTNPAAGPNFNTTRGIFIGTSSGLDSVGSDKIAIGTNAGKLNTGTETVAIGERAGESNSTDFQVAIGLNAGRSNSGDVQTAIGLGTGLFNTGDSQTAVGSGAGSSNTGDFQTAVGLQAGQNNIGVNQTAVGFNAGADNSGDNQVAIGQAAGSSNTGSNNVNIGYQAGSYVNIGAPGLNFSSSNSVFLGADTAAGGAARINQIVIGYGTEGIGSNSVILGNTDIEVTALRGKVGVNKTTPNARLDVNGDTIISGSLSILGVSGSSDAKIVKTAYGDYLEFEDYTSTTPTDHPSDVTYVAYQSGSDPIQAVTPHSLLNLRRYSGYNGTTYVPGFEEAVEVDGSVGWNSNSSPTSWYIRLGESGSVQPSPKMGIIRAPGKLWSNAVTGITNSAWGTYQHQTLFYNPVQIAGDTRIVGDLQIESNFVDDDASNSINNKALIQAGLLYLSNNF